MLIRDIVSVYPGIYESKCHTIKDQDNIKITNVKVSSYKLPVIFEENMWDYGYIDIPSIHQYDILHIKKIEIPIIQPNDIFLKVSGRQFIPVLTTSAIAGHTFTSSYTLLRLKNPIYVHEVYFAIKNIIVNDPHFGIEEILNQNIDL